MADEFDETAETTPPSSEEFGGTSDVLDETSDVPPTDGDAEPPADDPHDDPREHAEEEGEDAVDDRVALSRTYGNSRVVGTVTLHYEARDVRVVLDGASAMRLLSIFRQRREGSLGDWISPEANAFNGWLVLDAEEPLAMTWMPSLGPTPRTAIDPAPAA